MLGLNLVGVFLRTPEPELTAVISELMSPDDDSTRHIADCSAAISMLISFLQPILSRSIKCEASGEQCEGP